MVRRNRLNASYYCRHYYEIKKPECCSENVKEAELIEIVKNAICKQAVMAVDLRKVLDCQRGMERQKQSMLEKQKKELQRRILNLQNENFSLYEKYKAGEFSREEYMEQRQKCQKSIEWFQNQLDEYEKTGIQEKEKNQNILELLKGREQIKELTREMVEQLVSKIYVYGNNRVEIIFKFQDELAILMDSAEGYKM